MQLIVVAPEVIGIDLGGTAIKLGRFGADGTCLQSLSVPTPQPATPEAVLAVMVEAIAQIDPEQKTVAIGVGTPGPADAKGRIAKVAINLSGWHNVPLADWLEAKTDKATTIANDANCAGLGEAWLGAGASLSKSDSTDFRHWCRWCHHFKWQTICWTFGSKWRIGINHLKPKRSNV